MSLFEIKNILLHVNWIQPLLIVLLPLRQTSKTFIQCLGIFGQVTALKFDIILILPNSSFSASIELKVLWNDLMLLFLLFLFLVYVLVLPSISLKFSKPISDFKWYVIFSLHYIVFFVHGSSLFDEVLYTGIACSWHFDLY